MKYAVSFFNLYPRKFNQFHVTGIILAGILVFWPVYQFYLQSAWDDQIFVANKYTDRGFIWHNIWAIFSEYYSGQYAPVNQLYYTTLHFIFGYTAIYYHLASLFIHLINAVLAYFLIKRLCEKITGFTLVRNAQMAFLTALLFTILPVNLEPVAWVSASKVIIYALFYLIAITYYCRYIISNKASQYYLTVLFYLISFGAKEQAVMLPFCLLLVDYVYKRDFKNILVWYEKLPFIILSMLIGLVSIASQDFEPDETIGYPLYQRIVLAFYSLGQYIIKTILPANLSYFYPFPFKIGEPIPGWLWLYVCVIPVLMFVLYKIAKKRKWLLFGLLFFGIHIILVINLLSLARLSVIADRYAYVATLSTCFILAYVFATNLYKPKLKYCTLIIGLVYISYLGYYTHKHSFVWKNSDTLKAKATDRELKAKYEAKKNAPQI